jgi:hypothetical protein
VTPDLELYYQEAGSGTPIILIPVAACRAAAERRASLSHVTLWAFAAHCNETV